ncbi:MAG: IS66 family insertion sequence element accessory protein TnpB [Schwartzia sp.]|nr:IS66 family insertion sequence element accessory protein TnpB [Schwartzia sp. (in: firmicutes)]
MLRDLDLSKYKKVVVACGYTDLRVGAKGLVNLVQYKYGYDFYDKEAIFLFCGRKASTIKCVLYEGDGTVVLTKYKKGGRFQWPRTPQEARRISPSQFRRLMSGFSIDDSIPATEPSGKLPSRKAM